MPVSCPNCHAAYGAADVRLDLGIGTCRACGAVERLTGAPARLRPTPMPPARFTIHAGDQLLSVSWPWRRGETAFLVLFCLVWDGFLVNWYSIALGSSRPEPMMVFFPLLHVALGVYLTGRTLGDLVNHTRVDVDRHALSVSSGPLPFGPSGAWSSPDLTQLYVVRRRRALRTTGRSREVYDLMGVGADGVATPLVKGMADLDEAAWLERAIEDHLRIEDRPIAGEATA